MNQTIAAAYEKAPKAWAGKLLLAFLIACLLAWSSSTLVLNNVTGDGLSVAGNIISGIFHPDTELLLNLTTGGVPYLLLETLCIAFLGTIVGAVISVPLSFLSASNLMPRPIALVGRFAIAAIRTVPAFIYGLMFIRVTGPGPFAGLLTMSLCSIGMVSKMFIESIEDLDKRILESLDAAGCTTFQKIRYGILPQLFPDFMSTLIYRFDMNLRDATTLGLVGAGGVGAPLIFAMSSYRWNEVGSILLGLIVLVMVIEWISSKIRTKLARG
ncbi:MAG: phosphonate ABC transporter, permease protein PhnE [Clostridia bacterium]|nr:phosphonate ABC transporter, permease protein PhnE [Clostridia bacterium]